MSNREELKKKWRANLTRFVSSKPIMDVLKVLNLSKYSIAPMEACHLHECLNMMAYQFSSAGGVMIRVVTQRTVKVHPILYFPDQFIIKIHVLYV